MIFKGKITQKVTQTSGKTGKEYTTFSLGEKKFNCFDIDIIKNFQEGDEVEIITKTNGKYENMVDMKKVDVEAPKAESKPMPTLKPIPQEFHQSIEACRYEALDIAIKYLTLRGEKAPMDLLLNMSGVILEYILGKINMIEVKKDVKANVV